MFIVLNRSSGRVSLDEINEILPPGRFLVLDNLEYSDVVHALKRHLDQGTIAIIYVPRDADVIDPIEILRDPLYQRSVRSRAYRRPPPNVKERDRFLVPSGALGPWVGHAGEIAEWRGGRWFFERPREGMIVWVEDEERPLIYRSGTWTEYECTDGGGGTGGDSQFIVEVNAAEPIPAYRFVTGTGHLADAGNPTHVADVLGIALEEVTIVGKPVRLATAGVVDLPYDIQPGINLRQVYLWFRGEFKDIPPHVTDGAAFCLCVGRAVTRRRLIVDIEPGVMYR